MSRSTLADSLWTYAELNPPPRFRGESSAAERDRLISKFRSPGQLSEDLARGLSTYSLDFSMRFLGRLEAADQAGARTRAEYLLTPLPELKSLPADTSVGALSQRLGILPAEIPSYVSRAIGGVVSEADKDLNAHPGDRDSLNRTLFSLYSLSSSKEASAHSWLTAFRTYKAFADSFLTALTERQHFVFHGALRAFIGTHVNPVGTLSDGFRCPLENQEQALTGGDMCLVPGRRADCRMLIPKDAVTEAVRALNGGLPSPAYFHGTCSAALSGIGQYAAILSSLALYERGGAPRTGEVFTHLSPGSDVRSSYLNAVFVSEHQGVRPYQSYTHSRWFDEYPVAFGLDSDKVQVHARCRENGTRIGPVVPLTAISLIQCPMRHLPDVLNWRDSFVPHTKVISFEACELLDQCGEPLARVLGTAPRRCIDATTSFPEVSALLGDVAAEIQRVKTERELLTAEASCRVSLRRFEEFRES